MFFPHNFTIYIKHFSLSCFLSLSDSSIFLTSQCPSPSLCLSIHLFQPVLFLYHLFYFPCALLPLENSLPLSLQTVFPLPCGWLLFDQHEMRRRVKFLSGIRKNVPHFECFFSMLTPWRVRKKQREKGQGE